MINFDVGSVLKKSQPYLDIVKKSYRRIKLFPELASVSQAAVDPIRWASGLYHSLSLTQTAPALFGANKPLKNGLAFIKSSCKALKLLDYVGAIDMSELTADRVKLVGLGNGFLASLIGLRDGGNLFKSAIAGLKLSMQVCPDKGFRSKARQMILVADIGRELQSLLKSDSSSPILGVCRAVSSIVISLLALGQPWGVLPQLHPDIPILLNSIYLSSSLFI